MKENGSEKEETNARKPLPRKMSNDGKKNGLSNDYHKKDHQKHFQENKIHIRRK